MAQPALARICQDELAVWLDPSNPLISAKGTAAHRQERQEQAIPVGGVLETVTVLRVFLKSSHGVGNSSNLLCFKSKSGSYLHHPVSKFLRVHHANDGHSAEARNQLFYEFPSRPLS